MSKTESADRVARLALVKTLTDAIVRELKISRGVEITREQRSLWQRRAGVILAAMLERFAEGADHSLTDEEERYDERDIRLLADATVVTPYRARWIKVAVGHRSLVANTIAALFNVWPFSIYPKRLVVRGRCYLFERTEDRSHLLVRRIRATG